MRHLVAAGSAAGRLHVMTDRPNQDAFSLLEGPWGAVAVVCDGCGSEPKSGIGAALGASIAARAAARQLQADKTLDLPRLGAEVLAGLALIAQTASLDVREHFLFTVVGVAFAEGRAIAFACGDGVVAVDGVVRQLGPFPDNAPPYLAYALWDRDVRLECLYDGPAKCALIGTDGAAEGTLTPYWTEERFLRNPDLLRRSLKLQRLSDDATVAIVVREEL